jgi:hypothetical protein
MRVGGLRRYPVGGFAMATTIIRDDILRARFDILQPFPGRLERSGR